MRSAEKCEFCARVCLNLVGHQKAWYALLCWGQLIQIEPVFESGSVTTVLIEQPRALFPSKRPSVSSASRTARSAFAMTACSSVSLALMQRLQAPVITLRTGGARLAALSFKAGKLVPKLQN